MANLTFDETQMADTRSATLGNFILDEMRKRSMSMRKFAGFVGVSHATISRLVNLPDPPMPELDFLAKLASATKVDICVLVSLVVPGTSFAEDPEDRLLLARLRRLPKDKQEILESFIGDAALKGD